MPTPEQLNKLIKTAQRVIDAHEPKHKGSVEYNLMEAHAAFTEDNTMEPVTVWECKIVVAADVELPRGFDHPPRAAAVEAVEAVGIEVLSCFSGWGGSLTAAEENAFRHVTGAVEDNTMEPVTGPDGLRLIAEEVGKTGGTERLQYQNFEGDWAAFPLSLVYDVAREVMHLRRKPDTVTVELPRADAQRLLKFLEDSPNPECFISTQARLEAAIEGEQ